MSAITRRLREENEALRKRVAELEDVIEGGGDDRDDYEGCRGGGRQGRVTLEHGEVAMVTIPDRIAKLPRWRIMGEDYPVPYFVTWFDEDGKPSRGNTGRPDFRVMDMAKWERCWKSGRCWVCGEPLGKYKAYVIGPMCAVTRTTSEPGSHLECAVYSAQACPFLSNPKMKRGSEVKELPANTQQPVGFSISRNPGVCCVWVTKSAKSFKAPNGTLITLGDPEAVHWFAHGRAATKEEVVGSLATGFPALAAVADREGDGAPEELRARLNATMQLLPV